MYDRKRMLGIAQPLPIRRNVPVGLFWGYMWLHMLSVAKLQPAYLTSLPDHAGKALIGASPAWSIRRGSIRSLWSDLKAVNQPRKDAQQ